MIALFRSCLANVKLSFLFFRSLYFKKFLFLGFFECARLNPVSVGFIRAGGTKTRHSEGRTFSFEIGAPTKYPSVSLNSHFYSVCDGWLGIQQQQQYIKERKRKMKEEESIEKKMMKFPERISFFFFGPSETVLSVHFGQAHIKAHNRL